MQTIRDEKGETLLYQFTPADLLSNFVPLIVLIDDQTPALHFEYKMWNVLTVPSPKSEATTLLLHTLITQLAEELECEEHIYIYGKRDVGLAVLDQGIKSRANAVFIQDATLSLSEITTAIQSNTKEKFPILFLNGKKPSNSQEFVRNCNDLGIKCRVDVQLSKEKPKEQQVKEVLTMLEKMASQS